MAVFDLDEPKQGSWFEMEGGGRVQLKPLSFDDWEEIKKKTVIKGPPEYVKLDGKYERFQPESPDERLQLDLIWDRSIIAWEGIFDKNGKDIPCTLEFKRALMLMKDDRFRVFYNEKMKAILDVEDAIKEASEKTD